MNRYERRTFFERLCDLRDAYQAAIRSELTTMTISDAIAYGERLMNSPAALETVIGGEAAPSRASADKAG